MSQMRGQMRVGRAFVRALASLAQPGVAWHLLWPVMVAGGLWLVLTIGLLVSVDASQVARWLPESAGAGLRDFVAGLGQVAFVVMLLLLSFPFVYGVACVLVGTVAMPLMLTRVARAEYGDLALKKGGSVTGSVANALLAGGVFLLALMLSWPLFFVPLVGLVWPLFLTAWLNRKVFVYDALMDHASAAERQRLMRERRGGLWGVAWGCALLVVVPFANFFAAPFCGLVFVHFCLGSLAQMRAGDENLTGHRQHQASWNSLGDFDN